jgi:hypothetical protein
MGFSKLDGVRQVKLRQRLDAGLGDARGPGCEHQLAHSTLPYYMTVLCVYVLAYVQHIHFSNEIPDPFSSGFY